VRAWLRCDVVVVVAVMVVVMLWGDFRMVVPHVFLGSLHWLTDT
jgi:hypothetical protein